MGISREVSKTGQAICHGTDTSTLNVLLLGYKTPPFASRRHHLICAPDLASIAQKHSADTFDAIIVDARSQDLARIRALAPEPSIIAHLGETASQDEILSTIKRGADDVIGSHRLQYEHDVITKIMMANERRRQHAANQRDVAGDPLTGLPNRQQFLTQLREMLVTTQGNPAALMILDIDDFQSINDSLGHQLGDQLLQNCAQRLLNISAGELLCSRIGPDQFALAMAHASDPIVTSIFAESVGAELHQPFCLPAANQDIYITTSMGLTFSEPPEVDAEKLMRQANIALARARQEGRRLARFDPRQADEVINRQLLRNSLHSALAKREFFLLYQPLINCANGRIEGVESLLRWKHPSLGLVSPEVFIPLLEESELIVDVGAWVIEAVCSQLKHWQTHKQVDPAFSAAINISSKQFLHQGMESHLEQTIVRCGIKPQQIKLELTESLLVSDPRLVSAKLGRLKALGLHICIDDFGTGYASLSYLRQFPIDILKIDKSFIANIGSSENDDAIILAIIDLAHKLRLKVTAEGIENETQRQFLSQYGCDFLQGYLFSRPVPAAEISARRAYSSRRTSRQGAAGDFRCDQHTMTTPALPRVS